MSEIILPWEYSRWFFYFGFISLGSAIYAFTREYYDLGFGPLGVGINTINYWRKPDYSCRRYIDICWVCITLVYQCLRAIESSKRILFYSVLFPSLFSFIPGVYFFKREKLGISTFFHSIVHIGGNISNCILYSSDLPYIPLNVCMLTIVV